MTNRKLNKYTCLKIDCECNCEFVIYLGRKPSNAFLTDESIQENNNIMHNKVRNGRF